MPEDKPRDPCENLAWLWFLPFLLPLALRLVEGEVLDTVIFVASLYLVLVVLFWVGNWWLERRQG